MKARPDCRFSNFGSQLFYRFFLKRQFRFLHLQTQFGRSVFSSYPRPGSSAPSKCPPQRPLWSIPNNSCAWKADRPARGRSRSRLSPRRANSGDQRHRTGFGSCERCTAWHPGQPADWFRSWHPSPLLNLAGGDPGATRAPSASSTCLAGRTVRAVAQLPGAAPVAGALSRAHAARISTGGLGGAARGRAVLGTAPEKLSLRSKVTIQNWSAPRPRCSRRSAARLP